MSGSVEYGFLVLYALGKTKAINPKTSKSDDKIGYLRSSHLCRTQTHHTKLVHMNNLANVALVSCGINVVK